MNGVSMGLSSDEKRGHDIVGQQNEHAGKHDGRGGSKTDGLGAMTVRTHVREIALKTTDGGDDDGENHRLDEAVGDVFHLHAGLNAKKIRTGICPHDQNAGNVASETAYEVKHGRAHGEAYDGRCYSAADEVP